MSGGGVGGLATPEELKEALNKRLHDQFDGGYKILHARDLLKRYREKYPHVKEVWDDLAMEETSGSVHRG